MVGVDLVGIEGVIKLALELSYMPIEHDLLTHQIHVLLFHFGYLHLESFLRSCDVNIDPGLCGRVYAGFGQLVRQDLLLHPVLQSLNRS